MGRILALDVGDVRIGIALSDLLKIIATPYATYARKSAAVDIRYICDLIKEKEVELICCGLPIMLDGSDSIQTTKVRQFIQQLQNIVKIPIVFTDERLSTYSAEQALLESNMSRQKRKEVIDKVAAAIILQQYLDNK